MMNDKLDDTQKLNTNNGPSEKMTVPVSINDTQPIATRKPKRWRVVLFGILMVLLLGAAGGGLGYWRGIQDRLNQERQGLLTEAATQYQYGVQQMQAGNYQLARTHFEFVLQIYPDFPGLTESYTQVMVQLAESGQDQNEVMTTPTVDTRDAEALFNQAAQEVQSKQWTSAMNTLEALRNEDYTYRTLEVDGLYFIALRHFGIEKIVNEGDLEEGLYLLAILKQYAPLDHDSVNYSNWASLYLTGASYWEVDWVQVLNYFSQLYTAFPYMHDGTGWTAADRFMVASERYGDQLVEEGKHCDALDHYQNVLSISGIPDVQEKYDDAYLKCYPPTAVPLPTETPAPEITPTDETPTVEPTLEDPPEEPLEPPEDGTE